MEEKDKKSIEEMTDSEFFDFIAEKKIKSKIDELYTKYKKRTIIIISITGTILATFLGYQYLDMKAILNSYKHDLDSIMHKAENLENTQDAISLNLVKSKNELEQIEKVNKQHQGINEERSKIIKDYQELLRDKFSKYEKLDSQLIIHIDRSKMNIRTSDSLLYDLKTFYDYLNTSYSDTIQPVVKDLDQRTNLVDIAFSRRFVIAERSDRDFDGDEYRPAYVHLPFSEDILQIVFYGVRSEENPKEIELDFYLNQSSDPVKEGIRMTDLFSFEKENVTTIKSTDHKEFKIKPVFMYLPPNPITGERIPDFVLLQVELSETEIKNE